MTTAMTKTEKALTPVDKQMLSLMAEFERRDTRLANLLPPDMPVARFTESIRFALAQNPDLLKCNPGSIMVACMKAAKLGVDVSGGALGHGFLVPFGGECTFIQGYKGLVALAVASGVVKDMTPINVHAQDEFVPEEGDSPRVLHRPFVPRKAGEARGDIIATYTRLVLADGTRVIKGLLYLDDIARIEASVKARNSPWNGPHRPEQVKKSSVRNAFKTLGIPASEATARLRAALEADDDANAVEGELVATPPSRNDVLRRKVDERVPRLPERAASTPLEARPMVREPGEDDEPTQEQLDAERAARAQKEKTT